MTFSHILITRPRQEAVELAEMLSPCSAEAIILPAYDFHASRVFPDQISLMEKSIAGMDRVLLIFTSPRSVEYGLAQIPPDLLQRSQIAAIGPATAGLLEAAGLGTILRSDRGYSSEDLLEAINSQGATGGGHTSRAFIFAAPGGRTALNEGLEARGYEPHMLMVYERKSAELDPGGIAAIEQAESLLAVWTSANTMNALSQRLPASCWTHLCRAEWLVTSDRLRRVARAFIPRHVHLAAGPTNHDIFTAVKAIKSNEHGHFDD